MSVTLHTDVGDIKIELYCETCPKTCEVGLNYKNLQVSNFSKILPFLRIFSLSAPAIITIIVYFIVA